MKINYNNDILFKDKGVHLTSSIPSEVSAPWCHVLHSLTSPYSLPLSILLLLELPLEMFPLLLLIQSIPNLECYAEIKTLDFPDI